MFDTVMFGVPAYWAADKWFADVLPEDPVLNEALKNGIEGMMFNSMLNTISEEHSELDFTSLSATSAQGFGDLFVRIKFIKQIKLLMKKLMRLKKTLTIGIERLNVNLH